MMCQHPSFRVEGNVDRTTAQNDDLLSMRLHVKVTCDVCNTRMWFPMFPTGDSHAMAATDTTGYVLTIPLAQAGRDFKPDTRLPGVVTRTTDAMKGK